MALLKQFHTEFGTIRITRSHLSGHLYYYQDGSFHSQTDRHGTSVCAYVHVIHEIIRQAHTKHILVIGCAGGSLATMLHRMHCKVTTVDINPMAFTIARRYFKLPDGVRCIRSDGLRFMRHTHTTYDAIIIDVFGANNHVPRKFKTKGFFGLVKQALAPRGIMIMNVMTKDDHDDQADRIARNAEAAGMNISLFDWPGETDRNTLITSGVTRHIRIPSGHEPRSMKADMKGIIRRRPKRRDYADKAGRGPTA